MRPFSNIDRMAIFIIFSNIGLFLIIIIERLMNGLTNSEMADVLKLLLPIQSLYLTAVIRYILRSNRLREEAETRVRHTRIFSLLTKTFIYTHTGLLYGLILLYGLGGQSFGLLSYGIPVVESFFGIYVGMIVTSMYASDSSGPRDQ